MWGWSTLDVRDWLSGFFLQPGNMCSWARRVCRRQERSTNAFRTPSAVMQETLRPTFRPALRESSRAEWTARAPLGLFLAEHEVHEGTGVCVSHHTTLITRRAP